jgi:DNA repair exonuclease SbcCD ATPase subunit
VEICDLQKLSPLPEEIVNDPTGICCTAYPKCIHESAKYNHEVIHGKCNQYIDELRADCDRLAQEVEQQKQRADNNYATAEQNQRSMNEWQSRTERAEEAIRNLSCPHCGSDVNGNNWKKQARELVEALRFLVDSNSKTAYENANKALAAYNAQEGK